MVLEGCLAAGHLIIVSIHTISSAGVEEGITYPRSNTTHQTKTIPRGEILIPTRNSRTFPSRALHTGEVRLTAERGTGETASRAAEVNAIACGRRGTARAGVLPELAEFAAEFLAGGGPVGADVVADFGDVAFDFEFVFLEPRDVEFLAGCAAFELS